MLVRTHENVLEQKQGEREAVCDSSLCCLTGYDKRRV